MPLPTDNTPELPVNPNFKEKPDISFDELLSDLNTKKQVFEHTPPAAAPGSIPPSMPGAPLQGLAAEYAEKPPMDPEKAQRTGLRYAKLTDTVLGNVAGMVASSEDTHKYRADDGDIKDLAEAYADLAAESNVEMPPWLQVLFLVLMIYMPKFKVALTDRRYNKLKKEMEDIRSEIKEQKQALKNLEKETVKAEINQEDGKK